MSDKKLAEVTDKEEIVSLKENKEIKKDRGKEAARKKKSKKIALENIDLGTKPINISLSKYEFLYYYNLSPSMKVRIKIISIIAVIVIFFFILFTLKGKFHHSFDDEINENKNLFQNRNSSLISIKKPSFSSSNNNKLSSPSKSSPSKSSPSKSSSSSTKSPPSKSLSTKSSPSKSSPSSSKNIRFLNPSGTSGVKS